MKKLLVTLLFVGWYSFTHTISADFLNRAVTESNTAMVEKLLTQKTFTPKELRAALKIAQDVIAQKSSLTRTKMEWLIMLFGTNAAVGLGMQLAGFGIPLPQLNEQATAALTQIINYVEPDEEKRANDLALIPTMVKGGIVLAGFGAVGLGLLGCRKWRAPYERYDRAVKIGERLKAALITV